MPITIGANFAYKGKLPNFERDTFDSKATMKAFDETNIDEGHLSYCEEDGNTYQFKSSNSVDATTGRWRLFKTVADATLNATSTNAIQNKVVYDALNIKADKNKAFTSETVSTWPGQFVAGPINTRGNLSLRKIDAEDLPDLSSKYQKLDGNSYQIDARIAGLRVGHGIINGTSPAKSGFLYAAIPGSVAGQNSPDWYYATDGTLQDITAKYYNKTYLDDKFRVISASLNDIAYSLSGETISLNCGVYN